MTGPLSSVTMPDTMPSVWADANVDVIIRAAAIKVDKAFDSLVPISFSDIKSIIHVSAANITFLHKYYVHGMIKKQRPALRPASSDSEIIGNYLTLNFTEVRMSSDAAPT